MRVDKFVGFLVNCKTRENFFHAKISCFTVCSTHRRVCMYVMSVVLPCLCCMLWFLLESVHNFSCKNFLIPSENVYNHILEI